MEQVKTEKKQKIFFPNLDALRYFSYAMVFFFHIWLLIIEGNNIEGRFADFFSFLFKNGEVGVNFFFVLSGFLITYLLIEEKRFMGKIHVGKFWVRRILRIWPLFYLTVFMGMVIYPWLKAISGGVEYPITNPWTYFVFLNNFDFVHNGAPANISILWSVAIEEQFYLCWPLILRLIPLKKYPYVFFTIIIGSLVFRAFHIHDERVLLFHTLAVIGDMAWGGLLAYSMIFNKALRSRVQHMPRWLIIGLYAIAGLFIVFRHELLFGYLVIIDRLVFAFLFGLIILEQNFSEHSPKKLSTLRRTSKLGIYTYGLYCIHVSAILITEIGFRMAGFPVHNTWTLLGLTICSFFLSIGLAYGSYHLFEKWFLKFKDRFAYITKH